MEAYVAEIEPIAKPGHEKLALKLFFSGCDFNCPMCNTPSYLIYNQDTIVDIKEIRHIIDENLLFIDTIIFSGGEPCLQRLALLSLASYAKSLGMQVVLETNGTKTSTIKELLAQKLVDMIALDLKAPFEEQLFEKMTKSKTFFITSKAIMEHIKTTLALLREHEDSVQIEFRTTIVPTMFYKKEDLLALAKSIEKLNSTWVLQHFDNNIVLDKKLAAINSPSTAFLHDLKRLCIKEYPNLRIEVEELD